MFVGRIADRLTTHFGNSNVFLDIKTIPPAREFDEFIGEQVAQADALLAIIGPDWLAELQARSGQRDDFVQSEIEAAIDRSLHLIPVLIGGTAMPSSEQLPDSLVRLCTKNAFVVDWGRDFHNHLTGLIDELDSLKLIARYKPEIYLRDVLEPISIDAEKFNSIGIGYLLHCVLGSIETKPVVSDHLKELMNLNAVLFGSTLLQGGVSRSWAAKRLMNVYNKKGIFSNQRDNLEGSKAGT